MSLDLHEIAEAGHRILDPITDDHLLLLGRVARIGAGTTVLDPACGKAELLCRWAQQFGSRGHGVDISEVFVAAVLARVDELAVGNLVTVERGDARAYQPGAAAYDVGCCIGATWIGDGVDGTIDLLRRAVRPGGLVLIGEPFWREPPPAEALTSLGVAPGEFADLPGLLDRFEAAGTELVEMVIADEAGWDRYVAAQWWTLRQWLDTHPDDDRRTAVRAFLDDSRRPHLTYQRRYLGWGVFVLRTG